jgi:hypothetical protein
MSDNDAEMQANGQAESDDGECFIIAPIGGPQSETRKRTDGLLDEAIRPVVEGALGLSVIAPHEIAEAGSITRQVIQRLLEAELVVADLTNLNANVMYELAVRHAKGEPVVPIAEKGTTLPFDITTERTVFYEDSMHGLKELKPKLEDATRAALEDEEPDNPIYRAQQDFQMREAVASDDAMGYVLDRLDEIESAISRLSNSDLSKIGELEVRSPETRTEKLRLGEVTPEEAEAIAAGLSEEPKLFSAFAEPVPGSDDYMVKVIVPGEVGPNELISIMEDHIH